jgi:acetate kinase
MLGRPSGELRLVIAHLGGGASLCAVRGGRSVDTTMGFTPLEGLAMQVRSGSVDPGMLLWLQEQAGVSLEEVSDTLWHRSGLAGMSGRSGDMRDLMAARDAGDRDARLAFDVYCHRLRREIGAMVASAGGLDALVFTGGVGEHNAAVRTEVVAGLSHLGMRLDAELNEQASCDRDITVSSSPVRVLVVAAREELVIAEQVSATLAKILTH